MGQEPYEGWGPPPPGPPVPAPPAWNPPPAPGPRNPALPIAIALFAVIVGVGSYLILSGSDGQSSPPSTQLGAVSDPAGSPVLGSDAPTSIHDNGTDPVLVGKKLASLMNARQYKQLVDMSCAGSEGFTAAMEEGLTGEQELQSLSEVTYTGNNISKLDGGGDITFTATRHLYGFVSRLTFSASESKDTKNTLCTDHTARDTETYTGTVPWPGAGSFPTGVRVGACGPGEGVTGGLDDMMQTLDRIDPHVGVFADDLKELAFCAPGLQSQVFRLFADPIPYLSVSDTGSYPATATEHYRTKSGKAVTVTFQRHGSGNSSDYAITNIAFG